MTNSVIYSLIGLFLITSFTNVLATLKTILISKKIMNPVYILVFVDAMIFATVVSKVTSSEGLHFTIAYALGRTLGVYVGSKIEERMALGILEVDVFLNNRDTMIDVADKLREEGYTVNNSLVRGYNGDKRYKTELVIKRNEFKVFEDVLAQCGVSDPTLKIKNLSKVSGKISTTRINPDFKIREV